MAAVESIGAPATTEPVSPATKPLIEYVRPGFAEPYVLEALAAVTVSVALCTVIEPAVYVIV